MNVESKSVESAGLRRLQSYFLIAVALWSLIVGVSVVWNIFNENRQIMELVQNDARANFTKDQAIRFWATDHGGIYVEENARTPANPNLAHIEERDIVTPSGRRLTLMNPSYMLRQMMDEFGELYGVQGRITSFKPLNPNNAPDEWERDALTAFERGIEEVSGITEIDGAPYLKLMGAMVTTEGCLKCHAFQGYQVGDIRGGVGVAIPMQPYLELRQETFATLGMTHGGIWLLGLVGIGYARRQGRDQLVEREKSDSALRQSESRFHSLVENAVDAIYLHDYEGEIRDVNSQACESLGYSREELLALTIPSIDLDFYPEKFAELMDSLQPGKTATIEGRHRRKDGSLFPVEVRLAQIKIGEDDLVLAQARDITARKKADRKLKDYQTHLESMVEARTSQLAQAKEEAEAANYAKSRFLANMSHELRTPLNAILGFSQLMQAAPGIPASELKNLEIINHSGEHLLTLINAVLDMSKIEAGEVELEVAPFDLGEMVRDAIDMIQNAAEAKGLQVLLDQSSKFPRYIDADAAKLRQVLINLLNNALKYTEEGGISLRLGAEPVAESEQVELILEVEDSGIGIAPEEQSRVFHPFVQLDESGKQTGTGLGLTITRQFVELMGGSIELESEPGKGSVFRVKVPVRRASEAEIVSADIDKGRVVKLEPGQTAWRIMIVEDNLDSRLLLKMLLENVGFETREAASGEEAIKIFEEWHPHFIWMDRRLPVMDGLAATREIRKLPGGEVVKIAAVTASVFKEQKDEAMEAGLDDFVRKPFRSNEIFECMAKHLGVRYIYEEGGTPIESEPELELKSDALAGLSEALLSEFESAVRALDVESTREIITRIAEKDPDLASALQQRIDELDFSALERLWGKPEQEQD